MLDIIGFAFFLAFLAAFCLAIYYGVSGTIEWSVAGAIIGVAGPVEFYYLVYRPYIIGIDPFVISPALREWVFDCLNFEYKGLK